MYFASRLQTQNRNVMSSTYKYFVCLAILTLLFVACEEPQETIRPEVSSLTESVYASVNINPKDAYQVYANGQGILQRINVEEGHEVSNGQPLAKIQATQLNYSVDNAKLSLELAQKNYDGEASLLDNVRTELRAAQEQYALDSAQYSRQQNLWKKKIGSQFDLDQAKLRADLSSKKVQSLKNQIAQSQRELKQRVRQAQNNLKQVQSQAGDYNVTARMDGKVYSVFKEEGELISPQQPIMMVGHDSIFVVEMNIDEIDIIQVEMGQEVVISLDAYPEETFNAKVVKIFPQKDTKTQTFRVEADFVDPPKRLYPGLAGEANIIISTKEKVLTIPTEYLLEGSKVQTPDGPVEVKVGLRNFERVEILEGIDESSELVKP